MVGIAHHLLSCLRHHQRGSPSMRGWERSQVRHCWPFCRCSTQPRHVCVALVAVQLCHATYVSLFHSAASRMCSSCRCSTLPCNVCVALVAVPLGHVTSVCLSLWSLLRPLHGPVAFVCVGLPTVLYLLTVKCGELNNFLFRTRGEGEGSGEGEAGSPGPRNRREWRGEKFTFDE